MADSDKNILITPNTGSTTDSPKIEFTGGDNNTVTLTTLDDGTLSFSGTSGQLFSISDSLTGTIFSVNDVSGIPSIEVDDDGTVRLAEFGGNLLIGTDVASTNNYKVQVDGNIEVRGASSPYIRFTEGTTEKAYIQWSSLGFLQLGNDEDGSRLRLKDDLEFTQDGATWHSVFHEGYHPNADKWTTARTITLGGDLTGSVSLDGSSNVTLSAQVVNNSHTHDDRYARAQYLGQANIDDYRADGLYEFDPIPTGTPPIQSPNLRVLMMGNDQRTTQMAFNYSTDQAWFRRKQNTTWNAWREFIHSGNIGSQSVDSANKAGKWTNARTLSLTGDVTGSVSWDGSANASITTTVANDSHSHSNYLPLTGGTLTGHVYLNDSGDSLIQKLDSTSNYGSAIKWYKGGSSQTTYDPQIGHHNTGGDGTGSITILPYGTTASPWGGTVGLYIANNSFKYKNNTIWHAGNDGSGSGLDADLLDGLHASSFWQNSGSWRGIHTDKTRVRGISYGGGEVWFGYTGGKGYVIADGEFYANEGNSRVFHDTYHPNADKWTTARSHTVTLSGDVTGSATQSVDGTGNRTWSISTSVGNDSHYHSQVYIPDTRGAARAPSYYPDRYTSFDFQNTSDTGAGGDSWHVLQTVSPWSSYNNSHRQQQIAFTGTGGLKFRYATSDSAWASWQTLWTSGNDGSGSGLDADTLDGIDSTRFTKLTSQIASGDFNTIFNTGTQFRTQISQVANITNGNYSNHPTGVYTYGSVLNWRVENSTFQLYTSHTGDLVFRTGWNNDGYSGWRRILNTSYYGDAWRASNDGSGSGLDADLLDGQHASAFLLKTGGTISGTLTLQTTNDAQLYLNGNGSTWAGIAWTDVDSTDYMWYRGATGTFAIGGGGSSVSGKKLHIDGGTTIGANLDGTIAPSNGLKVEGEIHDNQGGVFSSYTHSGSDFVDGTLVQTDIPATSASGASYVLEVTGKSYSSSPPFSFISQGYLYNSTIINHSGVNLSGHGPSYIKAMEYNGNLCFWWPRISYWNSFEVRVRDAGGSSVNRVTSIGNATEPSATKKVQTNLVKTWNSGNDGSGSGLDADLLDGYEWMSSGKSVRASEFYADNWFRNYNSGEGLYNQANAMHWYSEGNTSYSIYSGQSTTSIRFKTSGNATRGYVYANNSNQIGFLNSSGGWSLKVDNSGNTVATGNVTAYSDERLKSDIKPIQNALKTVTSLNGVTYIRKDTGKKELGFIAQNVKKIVPELVDVIDTSTSEEEGYNDLHVMKYQNTVALLVEAIKEQQTQLNELQAQIKSLKEK